MKIDPLAVGVFLLFLGGAGGAGACAKDPAEGPPQTGADTPAVRLERMLAAVDALQKKPEHHEAVVEVQHILIGVAGGDLEGATRSPQEAEALAAELYARALAGEDFDTLERNHSSDAHPGIYTLSAQPTETAGVIAREDMVQGLGDVAWRLVVGEIGVARYDGGDSVAIPKSSFGHHIVKRLK